ncbi:MAG: LpqB family beta-propeller domain-containing protein [Blastocatellia bacterium]
MGRLRILFAFILALSLLPLSGLLAKAAAPPLAQTASREAVPYFTEPAVSPDRSEIAFVSGGDIWTAPLSGGEARLLISHAASESRPLYSPDGKRLAFVSTRTGNGDIYVLTLDSGELLRLTFDEANDQLDAWSRDGRWLYFSSNAHDIANVFNDIYRVSAEGGTPMPVSAERYVNEYAAAPSPDGSQMAFTARGDSSAQWWRKGHSHLDECEIWVMRDTMPPTYEQISDSDGKNMWPMWSGDGRTIYYVSDRNGAQNLWSRPPGATPKPLTQFKDGRVLWPNISYDGRVIVFEHDFTIWKFDTASNQASEVNITRRGVPAGPSIERLTQTSQIQEMQLSPDGQKVAFITHGEIFAASAKDGGDAARVTSTIAAESQLNWAPDSRRLVYVSNRDGAPHLFLYDFSAGTETQLTTGATADTTPRFSPDGKLIAYVRDARELRVLDPRSKEERPLATTRFERQPFISERPFTWSPDSRWLAFLTVSGKLFRNLQVVPAAGGEARPVSFLANSFSGTVSWSPDGKYLLFDTGQRTEEFRVARVDLVPRTPRFREDMFRDLFKEEAPRPPAPPAPQESRPTAEPPREPSVASVTDARKAPKPVEVVFDDIRRRLQLLPLGVDVGAQTISPDGKTLLLIADAAGQQNLYTYSLDELAKEPPVARQLTSTAGSKRGAQFTPDGKEVFYIEQGRINVVTVESRQVRPLAVTAELDVDFAREKMEAFRQAWTYLRDNFYDENFHGVNWEAVRVAYEPRIRGARTSEEVRRLMNLMVGELNASHSGVAGTLTAAQATPSGRIGLSFDRREYENGGRLRITAVLPLSPAALAGLKPGEYLLAVDGAEIGAHTNLDALLSFKVNRRVALAVAATADGNSRREVAVRPVSVGTDKGLLYRNWVEEQRAYVARVSNGRLGYVHMPDMGEASLAQLYVDLDVENHSRAGVVIDIRNNNGGFVNAYALDVFARRPYLTMTPRGFSATPARTQLGQRALEAPTILVTNQHSLSDAEDFTEGYRALKLGKVVGEPTAGWIIYTSGAGLIDGSSVRIPFTRITASDGSLMELKPRPVDVLVVRPIGESYTGRDSQLDAAVRELLKQIAGPVSSRQ